MSESQLFATMTFPEIYERVLVAPLFRPFAEQLLARLQLQKGASLIDLACGTGIVARIARERLGPDARIVGVDAAPPMLAVARIVDPTIDWREGSALSLPVGPDERFRLFTCHQGLQFFADKAAAVGEIRRVLEPGGRVAIGTWRALQDIPVALALNDIAERHVGRIADSRHSFGNAGDLKALLSDGGFKDVRVETVFHDVRFADGALFVRLNAMAVIGMSEKGKGLTEPERGDLAARITADSQDVISRHTRDGAFVFSLSTNIATARV
jgi:ubiquinone/menaquinone biosynthesis C-methylase UbiE